jgi:hypothetical protein
MKVWICHGSEHSARLILVGHFRDADSARLTEDRIKVLDDLALRQPEPSWEQPEEWYDEATRQALNRIRLWQITPSDLDNFRCEHGVSRDGDRIEISTEEYEIQGLIKVLVLAGARIEVYSHAEWNRDGTPIERSAAAEPAAGEQASSGDEGAQAAEAQEEAAPEGTEADGSS